MATAQVVAPTLLVLLTLERITLPVLVLMLESLLKETGWLTLAPLLVLLLVVPTGTPPPLQSVLGRRPRLLDIV